MADQKTRIPEVIQRHDAEILSEWVKAQLASPTLRSDLMKESELRQQSNEFIRLVREASASGSVDSASPSWTPVKDFLRDVSRSRALKGFTPAETATFILSLKEPLFSRLRKTHESMDQLFDDLWIATILLDRLGMYSLEIFMKSREEIIARQQREMFELSSPVVELWQGVLALPLIGTLDSKRTQLVMEALLGRIAETQAEIAVIDITGVPTVDTLTAQHLIKAVTATRLMGAECIISGIRPQIAQTIVHLGVDLGDVVTKATLAGALAFAFKRRGLVVKSA